jgi:LuxR family maltose regulon positive regulatory protein
VLERQAAAQAARGRLRAAERAARQALAIAEAERPAQSAAGQARLLLSEILYEWNQLNQAETLARQGLEQAPTPAQAAALTIVLARAAAARGDREVADQWLAERESRTAGRWARDLLAAWRVRLWLGPAGSPEQRALARLWAEQASRDSPGAPPSTHALLALTVARVWLAHGQARPALRILAEVRARAGAAGRVGQQVECEVLEALARQHLRQRARAFEAIWQALLLAEPEGMLRTFADEGPALARLLRRVPSHAPGAASAGPSAAYIQSLVEVSDPTAGSGPSRGRGLLTMRELDVLRGLAQGQSNREIAGVLGMAVGTVNRHVHHVLEKLDTRDRRGAVEEARRNGLL